MLKEKKKLNSKIDSLSRKVQSLQGKLTTATEAANKAAEAPALAPSAVLAPVPAHRPAVFSPSGLAPAPTILGASTSSRPTSRQRVATAPINLSHAAPIPAPPMPTFRPKTPESVRARMASGPSSTTRPKTPETRMPVFKARTPDRHRTPISVPSLPESSSTTSTIGVKRRAPDDFDDGNALPPQTFSADSAPLGHASDTAPIAQPTTPRLRKALQNMRTGFTPVRHQAASRAGSASPRRATTGGSVPAQPFHRIADVTNSPRAASHSAAVKAPIPEPPPAGPPAKKGWLGKIKSSGPSQRPAASAPYASRPSVFERPGMR